MKRFHFRLEKLLAIKKYNEKEWELKLARAAGECIRIENTMERNIYEKARTLKNRQTRGTLPLHALMYSELYTRRLTWSNERLREELTRKEAERNTIQKGYLEASKQRKVLDKLKERQEGSFYKKQRTEEMKTTDDMNNSMYGRKQEIRQGG
jgi:flagellar protein FliJ